MRSTRIALCATIALLAFSIPASAEESPAHELARKHFELGNSYYQVSNYTRALEEFEKAYALEPLPGLIFNIARCHEVMGNLKQAIAKYKLFIEKSPSSAQRPTVELRIQNLETRLKQQEQQQPQPKVEKPTPATHPEPSKESAVTPTPPSDQGEPTRTRSWKWPTSWALIGVGGASLITGIIFGVMVKSKNDEFATAASDGSTTYRALNDLRSTGNTYQNVEIATLVIGGVALAAGGGLLIWELVGRREAPAPRTALLPWAGRSGLGLNLTSSF
jgi:tetratricopeptide (TPR) repeat protein